MFDANSTSNIAKKAYNLALAFNWATATTRAVDATKAITVKGIDESAIQFKDDELDKGSMSISMVKVVP